MIYILSFPRGGRKCYAKCGNKSGRCDWCAGKEVGRPGITGVCCRTDVKENECDGNMGHKRAGLSDNSKLEWVCLALT